MNYLSRKLAGRPKNIPQDAKDLNIPKRSCLRCEKNYKPRNKWIYMCNVCNTYISSTGSED